MNDKKLDELRMELIKVREAIDMAETAMDLLGADAKLMKQVEELRKEEAILSAKLKEYN